LKLTEQLVLVTGGARGLGHAISQAVANQGAKVVINYYRSKQAAESLASSIGPNAVALSADVTDPEQVKQMFADAKTHFGTPITSIVNNALVDFKFNGDARKTIDTIGWADFEQQVQGALAAALHTIQAGIQDMKSLGFGRIVNVGTNLFQNPVVPYHDYTAAKAALLSLTRTAAQDLGPDGITVNMLSGGLLRTTDASAATPEFVFDLIAGQTPLRSVTTPQEFADAVLFFLSPWSRAVTGQNLIVDGGLVKN
jgi:3-oxoacyl-[acyl-carrier protein] reductase